MASASMLGKMIDVPIPEPFLERAKHLRCAAARSDSPWRTHPLVRPEHVELSASFTVYVAKSVPAV